jgi:lysozyme
MQISSECAALVSAWEGLPDGDPSTVNLDPYMDPVKIWTIGYGHALRDPATGEYLMGMKDRQAAYAQYPGGITKAQAVALLGTDLAAENAPVTALAGSDTSQPQFDALVSFEFNTGGLSGSTLLKLHRAGMPPGPAPTDADIQTLYAAARAKQLQSPDTVLRAFAAWSWAKGAFLGGLFCRRLAEWSLYSGQTSATANAFGAHVRTLIAS